MPTDIKFKVKGYDTITYEDIDNLQIKYDEYQVLISFDRKTRKGIKNLFFAIPKTELLFITKRIRNYE